MYTVSAPILTATSPSTSDASATLPTLTKPFPYSAGPISAATSPLPPSRARWTHTAETADAVQPRSGANVASGSAALSRNSAESPNSTRTLELDVRQTTQFDLAQPRNRFQPAKRWLDPRTRVLTLGVAVVAGGSPINRTAAVAAGTLRDVRRHAEGPHILDEAMRVVTLSAPTVRRRRPRRFICS